MFWSRGLQELTRALHINLIESQEGRKCVTAPVSLTIAIGLEFAEHFLYRRVIGIDLKHFLEIFASFVLVLKSHIV